MSGGEDNTASGEDAAVGGGAANTASGLAAVIPGGYYNQATGESSFAAGRLARAFHDRTFVWSDGQNGEFISTAVNQFLIHAAGGVGIGTSNPQAALDVAGKVKCQVLELAGADLAEKFDITGEATPGMVVCPDPENDGKLRLSAREYDRSAIGVVSGAGGIRTGLLLHQPGSAAEGDLAVAMTGRVYVQADASFGAIKPGDELTSSANPGHAMKVTDDARANRAVLGTALSTLKSGKGLVLVALQRR